MNKTEVLNEIKELINKIGSKRHQNDTGPYRLETQGKEIITKLEQLNNLIEDTDEQKSTKVTISQAIYSLSHTLGKEVEYADFAYKKTLKNNAPYRRTEEYEEKFSKASNQMNIDLMFIESLEL